MSQTPETQRKTTDELLKDNPLVLQGLAAAFRGEDLISPTSVLRAASKNSSHHFHPRTD